MNCVRNQCFCFSLRLNDDVADFLALVKIPEINKSFEQLLICIHFLDFIALLLYLLIIDCIQLPFHQCLDRFAVQNTFISYYLAIFQEEWNDELALTEA